MISKTFEPTKVFVLSTIIVVASLLVGIFGYEAYRVKQEYQKLLRIVESQTSVREKQAAVYIERVNPKAPAVELAAAFALCSQKHDVAFTYLIALGQVESSFNRFAVSPKKAMGVMQLTQATAESEGMKWEKVFDLTENICTAAKHIRTLHARKGATPEKVLNWYNGGDPAYVPAMQQKLLQVTSHFNQR
jgi:soluble lytic murein transglycosylase-like protein